MIEEPHPRFDQQDPPDGIVNPGLRDLARADQLLEQVDEFHVVILLSRAIGNHDHVEAGVDRGFDGRLVVVRELIDGCPVGYDEPVKPEILLEQSGQQLMIAMHLLAVPPTVRGHGRAAPALMAPTYPGR